jgi:hypothetical protein
MGIYPASAAIYFRAGWAFTQPARRYISATLADKMHLILLRLVHVADLPTDYVLCAKNAIKPGKIAKNMN